MTLSKEAVGLDMGKHSVKAAWISLSGSSPVIKRTEQLRLTSSSADNKGLISQWIEKNGILRHECVLGIPGRQCMFQPFNLAQNDPRTLEQAAAMEILNLSDLASEEMRYGFAKFQLQANEKRLLLCVVRPDVINASLSTANELHLTLSDLVPSPVGLLGMAFSQAGVGESPCIFANIGFSATEVIVGIGGRPMFARSFGAAGQLFTETVAEATKVPAARAENAKINEGSLGNGPDKLQSALRSATDTWISELRACMSVYDSMFSDEKARPRMLVLAGGGSMLKGLPEYLAEKLGMKVSLVAPPGKATATQDFPMFASAVGLAMAGLQDTPEMITLLPEADRDRVFFRRNRPFWIFASVTALLILGASVLGSYIDFTRRREHLQIYNRELEGRQALGAQLDTVRKKNQQIQDMSKPLNTLLAGASVMRDILAIVANNKAPGDWIGKISDSRAYFAPYLFSAPEKKGQEPSLRTRRTGRDSAEQPATDEQARPDYATETGFGSIIIEGYTPTLNFSTVKHLISKLRESGTVASADLLGDDRLDAGENVVRIPGKPVAHRFVIEIKLSSQ